ncbi:uncharacterized protein LY79DRAFT_498566, partial [Colletotrichum navitas]
SATFPKPLRNLAKEHLSSSSVRINISRISSTYANIMQRVFKASPFNKKTALKEHINLLPACRMIIFVNSKRMANKLNDFLYN